MTLVTVAIPTYERDHYLKEAIESVLAQTITDLEVVVSDNANSAATRALVESYGDHRLSYAPLPENIGLHGNLTRCLDLGSGPYLTVLLDDDLMYPSNLEAKLALLEQHPTAGVAHSAFDYIDHAGEVTAENVEWTGQADLAAFETGREFIERTMRLGTRVGMSTALLRRSAPARLRHDERDGESCDLGLWLRVATSWDFAFINEPLSAIRIHAESASAESGLYEVSGDTQRMSTLPMAGTARLAKLRFLDEYPTDGADRVALKRLVRDRARTDLKRIVADDTLAARRPRLTASYLYRAARVEPSLWWSPWSAVLLASSLFGRQLFDVAVDLRSER